MLGTRLRPFAARYADASAARALGSTIPRMRWRCEFCGMVEAGNGGAKRDRTADLLHAMQALSQLSYGPISCANALLVAGCA